MGRWNLTLAQRFHLDTGLAMCIIERMDENRTNEKRGDKTRREIYDWMIAYEDANKVPPTIREIMNGVGFSSTGGTNYQLAIMLDRGQLEAVLSPGLSRRLRVVREDES